MASPIPGGSQRVPAPGDFNCDHIGLGADARWPLPRGLIVVLSMTGLLVSVLALKQFAGIIAPVLLALILVISFHPLIGILCRRGAPQSQCRRSSPWRAVTWDPARACGLTADGDESQLTTLFDVLQPGDPDFDVVLP